MAVCRCRCHRGSKADQGEDWPGVDSRDFIACVFACDSCRVNHADVLDVGNDHMRPCPEMTVWVDPPLSDATGEGTE